MSSKIRVVWAFVMAIFFCILFYRENLGINLLIFESILLIILAVTKQVKWKTSLEKLALISLCTTSLSVVFNNSNLSVAVNILSLILFVGIQTEVRLKSTLNAIGIGLWNIPVSQALFIRATSEHGKVQMKLRWIRIFVLPIVVIFVFMLIYNVSNPAFSQALTNIGNWIEQQFHLFTRYLQFSLLVTFFVGLTITNYFFFRGSNQLVAEKDQKSDDNIYRKRKNVHHRNMIRLKNEWKSGIFLLGVLNLMLFAFNWMDVKMTWFKIEWQGLAFSEFVHTGVYTLIAAILISIALVLYYFNRNLNFYPKNKWLKYLAFIWLFQNGILLISVAMRNYWYISYYSLAYKRIGVYIFLTLVAVGLITVFIKVARKKSGFYLFRTNAMLTVIVLVIFSLFNWDVIIAKYNFRPGNNSFVYLEYMGTLSDKALPYLDQTQEKLESMDVRQLEYFKFREKYMTIPNYLATIHRRKMDFISRWEAQSIWSWNYADQRAYSKLSGK